MSENTYTLSAELRIVLYVIIQIIIYTTRRKKYLCFLLHTQK